MKTLFLLIFLSSTIQAQTYTYKYKHELVKDSLNNYKSKGIELEQGIILLNQDLLILDIYPDGKQPINYDLETTYMKPNGTGRFTSLTDRFYLKPRTLTIVTDSSNIHYRLELQN
jgi:hypothetical protein